jgi:hypothetical protein
MRIRCARIKGKDGRRYGDLTPGNTYRVIGIEVGWFRILSDEGLPYLFPPDLFEIVDPNADADWITARGTDGDEYVYPPELSAPGFFEDFFEHDARAVAAFRQYSSRVFRKAPAASAVRKNSKSGRASGGGDASTSDTTTRKGPKKR